MELRSGAKTIMEPNATARMSDGDRLSIAYTDNNGDTFIVNIEARAIALIITEQRSKDMLCIQESKHGNVLIKGGR